MRRGETKTVRVIVKMNVVEGKRVKGRSKNRWLDTIKNMRAVGVCVGDVENRDKWRYRTKVAGPQIVGRKAKVKKKKVFLYILNSNNHKSYSPFIRVAMYKKLNILL